ncbi:hypothetical protein D3C78_1657820 [compost metagenome]
MYRTILDLIHIGVQRGEFHPSQPLDTFVHWLISLLDGLYLESIVNGYEKIQLAKQFEFLLTICHSTLNPVGLEENL